MNQTLVTQLVSSVVGVIGALMAAKGLISADQATSLTDSILSVVGPLMTAGSIIFTAASHTASAQINSTSKLSSVKKIVVGDFNTFQKISRPNVVHSFTEN